MNILSVDLGTSNTVAVLAAHGRQPRVVEVDGAATMPSALFAAEGGGLVVGRDAERRARLDPARFEPNPKRRIDEGTLLLGDTVLPVTEALAAVLHRVLEETSRQLSDRKPDEVRLTHPAQWGPVRRNSLLSAARLAGMGSNLVLVPEPVAAAAHFASFPGQTLAPGQALAVYDLGAGTFDVAVVGATQNGFAVLAEAGLPDLGGLDVDQALLEHVGRQVSARDPGRWQHMLRPQSTADRRAQRALREDVKAAKEALSRHPQTEVPMPEPFTDVLVTRAELEALIRPSLLRSVELLAGTVRSTGMTPDQLVGIYLVGGSSRIPLVATLIAEQLRIVATNLDQPETAVALGAHHVAREAVSQRTEGLPPMGEERTSHLAAPPRPAPQQMPQPVPAAPPRPAYTPPPQPVFHQHSAPRPNRTPLIVGIAVVLVLALGGVLVLILNKGDDEGGGTPPAAGSTSLTLDSDCTDLLSPEEASEAVGETAERNTGTDAEGCNFESSDLYFRVYLRDSDGDGDRIEVDGYPVTESDDPGNCVLTAHVTEDPLYVVVQVAAQTSGDGERCPAARKVLSTVLGNLP